MEQFEILKENRIEIRQRENRIEENGQMTESEIHTQLHRFGNCLDSTFMRETALILLYMHEYGDGWIVRGFECVEGLASG